MLFTQHLFPSRKSKPLLIARSREIEDLADDLISRGVSFDIEVKSSLVWMSSYLDDKAVADRWVEDGPNVPHNVDLLVLATDARLKAMDFGEAL